MEQTTKIDLNELHFIVDNGIDGYYKLEEVTTAVPKSEELYALTALSLVASYRKTYKEVEIEETLLTIYTDVIKALINNDEKWVKEFINLLKDNMKGD